VSPAAGSTTLLLRSRKNQPSEVSSARRLCMCSYDPHLCAACILRRRCEAAAAL